MAANSIVRHHQPDGLPNDAEKGEAEGIQVEEGVSG